MFSPPPRNPLRMAGLTLALFLPLFAGLVAVLAAVESQERDARVALVKADQTSILAHAAAHILDALDAAKADLALLADLADTKDLLDVGDPSTFREMGALLLSMARSRHSYETITIIRDDGRAVLQADQFDGRPVVAVRPGSAGKRFAAWAAAVLDAPTDAACVLPPVFRDLPDPESPDQVPLLRLGRPVTGQNGRRLGAVLISLHAQGVMDALPPGTGSSQASGQFLILNSAGYFLKGFSPGDEWGHLIAGREARTFRLLRPKAWEAMARSPSGQQEVGEGLYSWHTVSLLSGGDAAPERGELEWRLVTLVPAEFLAEAGNEARASVPLALSGLVLLLLSAALALAWERHRAATKSLRDRERTYRLLFEQSYDAVLTIDCEATVLDANRAAAALFGLDAAGLRGRALEHLLEEGDRTRLRPLLDVCLSDQPQEMAVRMVRARGGPADALISVALADREKEILQVVVRDVTDRLRAERRLRESLLRMEALFENSAAALALTDRESRTVLKANRTFCGMTGYAAEEAVGLETVLLHPSPVDHVLFRREAYALLDERGQAENLERELVRKDGSVFPAMLSARIMPGEEGRQILWALTDLTEIKRAQDLREETERLIRHDLKTPLNGILGMSTLLLEGANLTPEQREMVEVIEYSGMTMRDLVDLSLEMHKLETGTFQPAMEPVDLADMVRLVLTSLELRFRNKDLRTDVAVRGAGAGEGFKVHGDPRLLYSLVSNLVKNALEAAPKGSAIRISLSRRPGESVLRVRNLGAVPADIRGHFFEKYVTGRSGGTGLGTYMARLCAEAHGGTIRMDTSETEGTVLTVTLPEQKA